MRRMCILLAFVSLATLGFGQQAASALAGVHAKGMDIPLPTGATVSFEVDARDDDLLALVKQLLSGDAKIPAGKVDIDLHDLSALLKNIHEIHVVSYTVAGEADPVAFYEPKWTELGMHRMLYASGNQPVLVMRGEGHEGLALVLQSDSTIVVARTDGMFDMPTLGHVLTQALSAFLANATTGAEAPAATGQPSVATSVITASGHHKAKKRHRVHSKTSKSRTSKARIAKATTKHQ